MECSRSSNANEIARLNSLKTYEILDTPFEKAFDDFTKLAAVICDAPIATLSFVDMDRVWFKSVVGLFDAYGATNEFDIPELQNEQKHMQALCELQRVLQKNNYADRYLNHCSRKANFKASDSKYAAGNNQAPQY
jgi:hypothetical protein